MKIVVPTKINSVYDVSLLTRSGVFTDFGVEEQKCRKNKNIRKSVVVLKSKKRNDVE